MKQLICVLLFEIIILQLPVLLGLAQAQANGGNVTSKPPPPKFDGKIFAIAFSLAHIPLFAGIAVAVVIGVYCCYRRKKRNKTDLAAIAEKGGLIVLDDHLLRAKEEGRLTVNVSVLENGKPSKPNDYTKQTDQKNGSMTTVNGQTSPDKKLHAKNQDLPPVPNATNPLPLTKDGYSALEQSNSDKNKLGEASSDGYTLLSKEGDELGETGYNEVNEQDAADSHYEMDGGLHVLGGGAGKKTEDDEHDYEEPYWEPASKEEELMDQLAKLNVPMIPAKSIEIKKHLGSGQFGTVYSGMWKKSESDYEVDDLQEVAVKSMKEGANEEERIKFLQEAAIMGQFKNPYILQILGYMTGDPLKIVVEIMGKGDLRQHLISLRPDSNQPVCKDLGAILLSYTRQIALGMGYLSIKQYIHRDLAARNVLVSNEGVCKIADFGLSRELQHEDYYISQGGKIPVKWTAPEALHYRKYSAASDIWSYGCLLYEIWSLGYKPFHDLTNVEAMQKIASGYRLPPPPGCPRSIYQLMIKCWHPSPSSRPIFSETVVMLQHPDFQILKWTEKDIGIINENARTLASTLEEGYCLYQDLQNTYRPLPSHKYESDQPQKSNLVDS